jgi:hypothetical protein
LRHLLFIWALLGGRVSLLGLALWLSVFSCVENMAASMVLKNDEPIPREQRNIEKAMLYRCQNCATTTKETEKVKKN